MKIYNTLTRKKEEFKSIEPGKINMYVCGPTVYDVPHIGHARSAYVFDVIRNYFKYLDYEVQFVRNVTDVDDKIINKAKQEIENLSEICTEDMLKEKVKEVALRYLDVYRQRMEELGIEAPTIEPKATECIEQMIDFIQVLIDKGYGYESNGNVYFSVENFKEYGKLSNQDKEEMMHGVRKEIDKNKKHPLDFALWKTVKKKEPCWESPWGKGRPGWHIECSVMSTNILGNQFDIHGGGIDLIFPHHENEIAQAEAATGGTFANFWIHNGLLTVNGEKMSKSLGNFITIDDFFKKHKDMDLIKLIFLNSHYRSPIDYSDEKIEEVQKAKERIMIFLDKVERLRKGKREENVEKGVLVEAEVIVNTLRTDFEKSMNDDFNTSGAISSIFEAVKRGNDILSDEEKSISEKTLITEAIRDFVVRYTGLFGILLKKEDLDAGVVRDIEELVVLRTEARKRKDFTGSDRIRDELLSKGVVVEDTPEGPVWRKN